MAGRSQFTSIVTANKMICREHYRLTLRLADFPETEPGQFVQIACRGSSDVDACDVAWDEDRPPEVREELFEPQAMLRRPFSLAGRRDVGGEVELEIIHRVVGVGTRWLSQLNVGDEVSILGPLGNRFILPAEDEMAIMVSGGVGIPPMLYLATKLVGREAIAFCGATTRDLLPLSIIPGDQADEFAWFGIRSVISTDDGSIGYRGLVTQALEEFLPTLTRKAIIYTCGPEPMMKRVAAIANDRGIECQVAVERAMACGMGTCQSCCIRVREGADWRYKLACTDGPVFRAAELLW